MAAKSLVMMPTIGKIGIHLFLDFSEFCPEIRLCRALCAIFPSPKATNSRQTGIWAKHLTLWMSIFRTCSTLSSRRLLARPQNSDPLPCRSPKFLNLFRVKDRGPEHSRCSFGPPAATCAVGFAIRRTRHGSPRALRGHWINWLDGSLNARHRMSF